jgi:hypothetical protein
MEILLRWKEKIEVLSANTLLTVVSTDAVGLQISPGMQAQSATAVGLSYPWNSYQVRSQGSG